MSIQVMDVYRCDKCKTTDTNPEGSFEVPLDWLTIRISRLTSASVADDLHICPNCKYDDLITLWETI